MNLSSVFRRISASTAVMVVASLVALAQGSHAAERRLEMPVTEASPMADQLAAFSYTGPWQLLPVNAIDGFKHHPGSRTFEYVDKYHLRNQSKGAPDVAYVHRERMAPRSAP